MFQLGLFTFIKVLTSIICDFVHLSRPPEKADVVLGKKGGETPAWETVTKVRTLHAGVGFPSLNPLGLFLLLSFMGR